MSKKEKIDLKNKIDAVMFAMTVVSDRMDEQDELDNILMITDEDALKVSAMYKEKCNEHLNVLEDIRAEYQKRLSQ